MELCVGLRGRSNIEYWANKYNIGSDIPIKNLVCGVKERGYLTESELVELVEWKIEDRWIERVLGFVQENSPDDVQEVTRQAFLATDDRNSICCLLPRYGGLKGVGLALGSAILHWFHEERYPIWDIHAKKSVQYDESQYENDLEGWKCYVKFCRGIADRYEVDMRTLDRALFIYGQNNSCSCESN